MMKKLSLGLLGVIAVLFVMGCQPAAEQDLGAGALAGEAVRFPGGDIVSVQYLDTSIHTTTAGGDYQCTKMTAGTACALVAGRIQRTYVSGGVTRTATYADGCQTAGSFKRSYDYGCLGSDVITCWKVCSAAGCDISRGICAGDAYGVCGNGVQEGSEGCDAAVGNGVVCTPPYQGACAYCSTECTVVNLQGGECGDGTIQPEETCDDGNDDDGDGCSGSCFEELPKPCTEGTYRTSRDGSLVEQCQGDAWVAATCSAETPCIPEQVSHTYCDGNVARTGTKNSCTDEFISNGTGGRDCGYTAGAATGYTQLTNSPTAVCGVKTTDESGVWRDTNLINQANCWAACTPNAERFTCSRVVSGAVSYRKYQCSPDGLGSYSQVIGSCPAGTSCSITTGSGDGACVAS